jgi:hypothetical protein
MGGHTFPSLFSEKKKKKKKIKEYMNHTLTSKAGVYANGQKLGNTTDGKRKIWGTRNVAWPFRVFDGRKW